MSKDIRDHHSNQNVNDDMYDSFSHDSEVDYPSEPSTKRMAIMDTCT